MNQDKHIEDLTSRESLLANEIGEPDESFSDEIPQTRSVWDLRPEFDAYIASLNLRHFSAGEFLVKGGSHHSGGCAGENTNPPKNLWANIADTARVIDSLRANLGHPIRLTSAYRSPSYNSCIGGVSASQHMRFNAIDFQASSGNPASWAAALRRLRDDGIFLGGIGVYNSFVHLDTRGHNADW